VFIVFCEKEQKLASYPNRIFNGSFCLLLLVPPSCWAIAMALRSLFGFRSINLIFLGKKIKTDFFDRYGNLINVNFSYYLHHYYVHTPMNHSDCGSTAIRGFIGS
jgi:hypothetical protein